MENHEMNTYVFYVEGLNREMEIVSSTEKMGRKILWDKLEDYERDRVVQIECLDIIYGGKHDKS
jgi:hypothetical protein